MNNKKRVLVGLSWWVDSAVSAHLLIQSGYEVIGWFMINYADSDNPHCHTKEDKEEAERVAQFLWIKTFITFDFREEYDATIIEYIYEWYEHGYTPNPDVLCNTKIKFDLFLNAAKHLNCTYVATGHYARLFEDDTWIFHLLKWNDQDKDQSYFLSWLQQQQLAHALFPIWEKTKQEVREIAQRIGLPNAARKDSQGLCFIGKVPMKQFLMEHLPHQEWAIKTTDGNVVWTHQWHYFYTIWQRQWLWLSWWPRYVIEKNATTNELIVWHEDDPALFTSSACLRNRHRIWKNYPLPFSARTKIRYRQPDQEATLVSFKDGIVSVEFLEPQRAVTPWQVCVVYQNNELVWSWIIQ